MSDPNPRLEQAAARSESNPLAPPPSNPRRWFAISATVVGVLAGALVMGAGSARAAWQEIAQLLSLKGGPEPASANVLSEHELESLDQLLPQSQAQLLLERSINHYRGANDQIEERVSGWRGKIKLDANLNSLFMTALNSDDLRVRAAAIEIDLASRDVEKDAAAVDRMEHDARFGEQGPRANALWDIALLEGLAYLGTDETLAPLLQVFHDDSSPMIRERAACGLAQSGMLNEKQRRSAVPQLLNFADDASLDPETHKWVFQALRDITGQSLPHDPAAWRNWYSSNDGRWTPVTRDSQ
jgi:hypothetical protein